ncbi:hypothetical protein [Campylobacter corcagiensis]|uniref:Uncharacterized protein n=1 Tax=Campylobacter corcagiensis TaxID=1448857 RepID=A0A7M1LGN2_9BACT|nr:hypothetical protein [Campylobacter corcagiensis]QKF64053.1 hypothetical protein CCORG_0164 [Campylobacter corcagiensis]QOQ87747.1 hypothetical protein IMC76_02750 [Campylobacter corcagiensis]
MKFWLHKINPSQSNETNCFNLLIKLNLLATGYSDMAKSFIYDPNNKLQSVKEALDKECPGWNYNYVTENNVINFVYEIKKNDIIVIPLTQEFDNEIYICQIISNKVINVQNGEIPQIASDIGFLHLVKFIKNIKFNQASQKLQALIENNKRKNTTIEINDLDIIKTI